MRAPVVRRLVLYLLPVAATAAIFWPVTRSYFFRDDFYHLFQLGNRHPAQFILRPFGGHLLVLRNLMFVAMRWTFGTEPYGYFCAAFATHLINVVVLTHVLRRLTGDLGVSSAAALLWGTSPTAEETLTWYSVYGQAVATTCILLAMLVLLRRGAPIRGRVAIAGSLIVAASLSFGTGIAVAIVFPLLVWLLLSPSVGRHTVVSALSVPVVVGFAYGADYLWASLHGVPLGLETAMVQHLWEGARRLLPVGGALIAGGFVTLTLGWHYPLASFPTFAAWIVIGCWAFLGIFAALPLRYSRRRPPAQPAGRHPDAGRAALVGLCIATSCYALIALGRASVWPMPTGVLVAMGRYHYTALVGVAVVAAAAIGSVIRRLSSSQVVGTVLLVPVALGVMAGWLRSDHAIDTHAAAREEVATVLQAVDRAAEAVPRDSSACIPNQRFYVVPEHCPRRGLG